MGQPLPIQNQRLTLSQGCIWHREFSGLSGLQERARAHQYPAPKLACRRLAPVVHWDVARTCGAAGLKRERGRPNRSRSDQNVRINERLRRRTHLHCARPIASAEMVERADHLEASRFNPGNAYSCRSEQRHEPPKRSSSPLLAEPSTLEYLQHSRNWVMPPQSAGPSKAQKAAQEVH